MINLDNTPEDVLTVQLPQVITLNGIEFNLEVFEGFFKQDLQSSIILTTTDSDADGYNNDGKYKGEYKDYITHVRERGTKRAVLPRTTLYKMLTEGEYYIG